MQSNIPKISESEYEIMKIVWNKNPLKAQDIVKQIDTAHHWSEKTIKTMINRLLKKEALGYERDGKSYLYYPLVNETDCRKLENQSFLKRVYNGSINNMMLHFIKETNLSPEEIEELKKLLDEEKKS